MNPSTRNFEWFNRMPAPARHFFRAGFSLVAGLAVGLVIHYVLYRIGLPSRPFIYVAF